ncbi:hypothetical protein N7488_001842 [Penicillium malachiteum]|nr:hypothetical protein N7488_001842 [Penicillium malachiteum]
MLKRFGGRALLNSYEVESMPVGIRSIDQSGAHFSVHGTYNEWVKAAGESTVISDSLEGHALRQRIKSQVTAHYGKNKDHGIEIGYRYKDSPIIVSDSNEPEPERNARQYIPSTWPGARAPSVFLADGGTNIYDFFGREYTIIDFTDDGHISHEFMIRAAALGIPLTRRHLPSEQHAHSVWQRSVVFIRPDDHVAWRSPIDASARLQIDQILRTVTGQVSSDEPSSRQALQTVQVNGFTGTVGNEEPRKIQMPAAFQH